MKWLKIIGGISLLFIAALAAVPFFVTLDDYIPRIEQEVSARLQEPVKIGSLRAAGLPLPHVSVRGVTVGKTEDIKVGSVTVTPDLWSLMSATKVIRSIEIDGLTLTQKAADKIPTWIPPASKPGAPAEPPAVRIQSIKLDDAVIKLQKARRPQRRAAGRRRAEGRDLSHQQGRQQGRRNALRQALRAPGDGPRHAPPDPA